MSVFRGCRSVSGDRVRVKRRGVVWCPVCMSVCVRRGVRYCGYIVKRFRVASLSFGVVCQRGVFHCSPINNTNGDGVFVSSSQYTGIIIPVRGVI